MYANFVQNSWFCPYEIQKKLFFYNFFLNFLKFVKNHFFSKIKKNSKIMHFQVARMTQKGVSGLLLPPPEVCYEASIWIVIKFHSNTKKLLKVFTVTSSTITCKFFCTEKQVFELLVFWHFAHLVLYLSLKSSNLTVFHVLFVLHESPSTKMKISKNYSM